MGDITNALKNIGSAFKSAVGGITKEAGSAAKTIKGELSTIGTSIFESAKSEGRKIADVTGQLGIVPNILNGKIKDHGLVSAILNGEIQSYGLLPDFLEGKIQDHGLIPDLLEGKYQNIGVLPKIAIEFVKKMDTTQEDSINTDKTKKNESSFMKPNPNISTLPYIIKPGEENEGSTYITLPDEKGGIDPKDAIMPKKFNPDKKFDPKDALMPETFDPNERRGIDLKDAIMPYIIKQEDLESNIDLSKIKKLEPSDDTLPGKKIHIDKDNILFTKINEKEESFFERYAKERNISVDDAKKEINEFKNQRNKNQEV